MIIIVDIVGILGMMIEIEIDIGKEKELEI